MKFGGTSDEDAAALRAAGDIVRGRLEDRRVVVVSGMARVADGLLDAARRSAARDAAGAEARLRELEGRHLEAAGRIAADAGERAELERAVRALMSDLAGLLRSVGTLGELTP